MKGSASRVRRHTAGCVSHIPCRVSLTPSLYARSSRSRCQAAGGLTCGVVVRGCPLLLASSRPQRGPEVRPWRAWPVRTTTSRAWPRCYPLGRGMRPVLGHHEPRWQGSIRRRGSTRLDPQPQPMRVSGWSKTEAVKGPTALGVGSSSWSPPALSRLPLSCGSPKRFG